MMKKVSSSQLLYGIVPLFAIGILAARFLYVQKKVPITSHYVPSEYSQSVSNISEKRNVVDCVVFDSDNRLQLIKNDDVLDESGNKLYTLSKSEIQDTYFPDFTGINNIDDGAPTNRVAFSKEGNLLLGANGIQVGVYDIAKQTWFFKKEIQSGMEYHPLGFLDDKTAIVLLKPLSPTITQRPYVCFLDIQTGKINHGKKIRLPKNTCIDGITLSDTKKQIIVTTSTVTPLHSTNGTPSFSISGPYQVFLFDAVSLRQVNAREIPYFSQQILLSQDGNRILLCYFGFPQLGHIWDVSTDALEEIPSRKQSSMFGENILGFSPNGRRVAAGDDKGIRVWDTKTKKWEVNLDDVSCAPFNLLLPTYSSNGLIHQVPAHNYFYKMHSLSTTKRKTHEF
jgi:WD40 repeat protein